MRRKVLSLVLVLTLVLGSVGMAFAAPADVKGEKFEDAVNVLMDLGVVTGYPDGTYRPAGIVTRAEMAAFIIRALGLEGYAVKSGTPFSDVSADHWASGYINYAATLGIINGYPDGTFKPDNTVSYDEAVKMLVCALGYKLEYLGGTYPGAFVSKAKALGIIEGVQAGSAGANRGDIATLVYQTLHVPKVRYDKDGALEYEQVPNPFGAGTIDETMGTRLGAFNAGVFVVDNADVDTSLINISHLLGAEVEAYVNKDLEIIGIKEVNTVFLTGEMNLAGDEFEADKDYIVTSPPAEFTASAFEFVNGEAGVIGPALGDGNEYTIAAEVSGITVKRIVSVAQWNVTADDVIEAADLEDIKEDDELFGVALPKDDDDEVDHKKFSVLGADGLGDLKVGDVAYVYQGGVTNKITRILVGREVVEGQVSQIKAGTYTIDGKGYDFADPLVYINADVPAPGDPDVKDVIEAKLDYFGDIYKYETVEESEKKIAIIIQTGDGQTGLTGKAPKAKLLLADGTSKVFDVDYKAVNKAVAGTLDDTMAGGVVAFDTTVGSAALVGQYDMIKYTLNSDGEISKIEKMFDFDDTVDPAGLAGIRILGMEISKKGIYNSYAVSSSAVIFTVPSGAGDLTHGTGSTDSADFGVVKLDAVLDSDVGFGFIELKDGIITAMVIDDDTTATQDDTFAVYLDAVGDRIDGKVVDVHIAGQKEASKNHYATEGFVAPAAGAFELYKITYNTKSEISELTEVGFGGGEFNPDDEMTLTGLPALDGALKVSGNVVTIDVAHTIAASSGWTPATNTAGEELITLASDVVVFTRAAAAGSKFKLGSTRDLQKAFANVMFFDLDGDDKVIDIIIIQK